MKEAGKITIMIDGEPIEVDEVLWDLFEKTCRKEGSDTIRVLEFMIEEVSKLDLSDGFKKLRSDN